MLTVLAPLSFASDTLLELQHKWAVANYEAKGDMQVAQFERLIAIADKAVEQAPKDASLWTWNGIIKSTFAGVKGGLGALGYAKAAKKSFEQAIAIDGSVLDGSAYTSLGVLYYNVPGWPIGFGDKKKAEKLLKKALVINPDGIDSNYFYADYFVVKKDYKNAQIFFLKAQKAAPRASRPLADKGRQQEISEALTALKSLM